MPTSTYMFTRDGICIIILWLCTYVVAKMWERPNWLCKVYSIIIIVVQFAAQASLMTAIRGHQLLSGIAIAWTYRMDGPEDDEQNIICSHEQPSFQSVASETAVIVTRGYSFNRTGGRRLAPSSRPGLNIHLCRLCSALHLHNEQYIWQCTVYSVSVNSSTDKCSTWRLPKRTKDSLLLTTLVLAGYNMASYISVPCVYWKVSN